MKYAALIALALIGCGTDPSKEQKPAAESQQQEPKAEGGKREGEAPEAAADRLQSIALASAADLPACDEDASGQLVYLRKERQFLACEAGEWLPIDISGQAGKAGENGQSGGQGAKGDKGDKGDQGTAGSTGAQGTAEYSWTDPVSGKRWLIMGWHSGLTAPSCTAPAIWALPTPQQASDAIERGLFDVGGPETIWLPQAGLGTPYRRMGSDRVTVDIVAANKEIHGLYCVEQ